jgi:Tol biopolymer transport system component
MNGSTDLTGFSQQKLAASCCRIKRVPVEAVMRKTIVVAAAFVVSAALATYRGSTAPTRLQYITTAHQAGPVGFRDPIGAVSPDGAWLAYISNRHVYLHRIEGSSMTELLPADNAKNAVIWFPESTHLAVLETAFAADPKWFRYDIVTGQREPLATPPATTSVGTIPAVREKTWGTSVLSPDRHSFYYSIANAKGTLDLWSRNVDGGDPVQLTSFDRDTYDPSITTAGDVLFKTQVFSAFLGTAPSSGGSTHVLTTFQSETPTWSPDGRTIAFTFGTWRRVVDDARYPDIAQDLGLLPFADRTTAAKPEKVFQASPSEDQSMVWSPNGKWVVFHSHRDKTDDLFLQPADGSQPPRQITKGGIETGWPRWSPDGRWIAYGSYPGEYRSTRGRIYIIGIDEDTGKITQEATPIEIQGQTETAGEPNWLPDSDHLVFDSSGGTPGRKLLAEVSRKGGAPRKIIEYPSDQVFSGISASPDGKWAAYVANAPDGTYQIFRVPVAGGAPQQVTTDPNHKTQPSFSPDGTRLAFTIWRYDVQFWMLRYSQ